MRPLTRVVLAAVVAAAGPIVSACDSLSNFSLDNFEIFDSKKKLTGERKPVFPEGVPGVASGVPPELVKGYHEPEGGIPDPAKVAAEAAAEPAAKPKKPKPAPERTASKPAPKPQAPPDPYAAAATRAASKPAPKPQAPPDPYAAAPTRAAAPEPAPQAATAPWPSAQPQAAWPGTPGTVSR
jgi:hypothetical protein